jgi:pimeloyl-ACP methyl ester carboxylesterase
MKPVALTCLMIAASFHAFTQWQPKAKASFTRSVDNIPIAYEVRGKGSPALVFVHGWSCNRGYWNAQLPPFSENHTVVAIDLGGHGESGLGRQSWTIYSFGSDVAAVVRKLGLQSVVLIAHSMGGDVIVDAARQLPGRVAGLVMVDTYKARHSSHR